tara:strand:- start:81 stop:185 length:105 start_codon:yes stop_codon:yes gene_type:complete
VEIHKIGEEVANTAIPFVNEKPVYKKNLGMHNPT